MRISHLLTFAVLFVILSNPAFAQQEPITLTLPQSPYIVNPNPALADVNCFYITVRLRGAYNDSNSALTTQIEQQVEATFRDYDINVIDTNVDANSPLAMLAKKRLGSVSNLRWRPANVPEFRIEIDLLNLPDTNQCIFRLQTSFLKRAQLENGPKANMMADVWKDEPVMRLVATKDLAESLISAAIVQARAFIGSWSVTRAADKQSEVSQTKPQLRKATDENDKQQSVESKYVSSKNSQIFHKASCSSAKRISPNNLVSYATRDAAIAAGKKPCERCNP
ncbi:MAG: Ada metal-binding domain-containing protein [Sedimentisphaerales bacterium]